MGKIKVVGVLFVLILIVFGAVYFVTNNFAEEKENNNSKNKNQQLQTGKIQGEINSVKIIVPENMDTYKQNMIKYAQMGEGQNPAEILNFTGKIIELKEPTKDKIRVSAQKAAQEISLGGGPKEAKVNYLKVEDKTAYILLNIDQDGYAGVSVDIATIHPIVKKTLLQFQQIDKVVFSKAPSDQ